MVDTTLHLIQVVLMTVGVFAAVVLTGGGLFLLGWRYVANDPKACYGPAVGVALASAICFPVVTGMTALLLLVMDSSIVLGGVVGLAVGLATTWVLISGITRLTFTKAALASVPLLLGTPILVLPVLLPILLPSLSPARDLARTATTVATLNSIGKAVNLYVQEPMYHRGQTPSYPPDLQTLVKLGLLKPGHLKSSRLRDNGRECDYFYLPPTAGPTDPDLNPQALMVCAFADCLKGDRAFVSINGSVDAMKADTFEAEYAAKPENAAFVAALRAEEARLGIAPPR